MSTGWKKTGRVFCVLAAAAVLAGGSAGVWARSGNPGDEGRADLPPLWEAPSTGEVSEDDVAWMMKEMEGLRDMLEDRAMEIQVLRKAMETAAQDLSQSRSENLALHDQLEDALSGAESARTRLEEAWKVIDELQRESGDLARDYFEILDENENLKKQILAESGQGNDE